MPRKDIDLEEPHITQLDVIRAKRRVSYSDIVKAALDEYFAPKPEPVPVTVVDRLDGIRQALEQIQQRLWNLDSSSQKTAERLAALEGIAQESMELLILIGERLAPPVEGSASSLVVPKPAAATHTTNPGSGQEPPITDILHDPRSQWYIPPEPPPEKRLWYRRSRP